VIVQLRKLHLPIPPQGQVVFLNDPFRDWDMTFSGTLWFADRTIHLYNQRLEQLSPAERARMDVVFDFQNGGLVQLNKISDQLEEFPRGCMITVVNIEASPPPH
jgi:hypothetical protein